MTKKKTDEHNEAFYQDLVHLIHKHDKTNTAEAMLAIASNIVGKLIAQQDQRTMTTQRAMQIVMDNIEMGNAQLVAEVANSKGSA